MVGDGRVARRGESAGTGPLPQSGADAGATRSRSCLEHSPSPSLAPPHKCLQILTVFALGCAHHNLKYCFAVDWPDYLSELCSQGIQIHRPIIYGNTAIPLRPEEKELAPPEHTHRWTVAVRSAASAPNSDIVGGADDLSYFLKRVTFKLHESFPNATRSELLSNSKVMVYVSDKLMD